MAAIWISPHQYFASMVMRRSSLPIKSDMLFLGAVAENIKTRLNTRHKMRLAVIREKALRPDGPTARRTDGRTDTPSYRDATAHLKIWYMYRVFLKKVLHKREEKMQEKMKMTSQKDKNLVHVNNNVMLIFA